MLTSEVLLLSIVRKSRKEIVLFYWNILEGGGGRERERGREEVRLYYACTLLCWQYTPSQ